METSYWFYTGFFRQDGMYIPKSGAISTLASYVPFSEIYEEFVNQDGRFTITGFQQISEKDYDAYFKRHSKDGL